MPPTDVSVPRQPRHGSQLRALIWPPRDVRRVWVARHVCVEAGPRAGSLRLPPPARPRHRLDNGQGECGRLCVRGVSGEVEAALGKLEATKLRRSVEATRIRRCRQQQAGGIRGPAGGIPDGAEVGAH
jgi:hypothetical protein